MSLSMFNVVVVTPDVVGERMAGPGIRAFHLADELARHFPTTLIARQEGEGEPAGQFAFARHGSSDARRSLTDGTVLIGQPVPDLLRSGRDKRVVFDLFDPNVLELQELYGPRPSARESLHLHREWSRLRRALDRADLLLCATERQRDFYTGLKAGLKRVDGAWMARWIVLPFGIEPQSLEQRTEPEIDSIPNVLWGGGTWEWLDPVTAVQAVRLLNGRGVECRLTFLGGKRPNHAVPENARSSALRDTIRAGGDLIRMNEEWVPYRKREKWLRSSKVAIMLHRATAEAHYSIRTRLFDAIWAGLPVVATRGGFAAELVEQESCGLVVEPEDAGGVANALEKLLRDDGFRRSCVLNLERIRPRFLWERVTAPLVDALREWQKATS